MRPSTVVGRPSNPRRHTLTASWYCPEETSAWPRVTKSLCDTSKELTATRLFLHHRFGQAWHRGAAKPCLVDHPPRLAVSLPGLDRVGLVHRALRRLVPAELDLDARGVHPARIDVDD